MAVKTETEGRQNQRHRTRKDLLSAAARLLKAGKTPDMDDVAREAMVSRATAYRYFPTIESLMVEAPIDGDVPSGESVFAGDTSTDPVTRVEKAESAMHEMVYRNEAQLRMMLSSAVQRAAGADGKVPVRQNRRTPLIEAALAPAKKDFTPTAYRNLCAALALIFGTESMIVFRDVLNLDEASARKVKAWALRALIEAAKK
jgi:AcrR family transcriptional regulator